MPMSLCLFLSFLIAGGLRHFCEKKELALAVRNSGPGLAPAGSLNREVIDDYESIF